MQKGQVIFLSFLLAAGIMVGMSLGLAANIAAIQAITSPEDTEPIVAPIKDSSHAMASDQIDNNSQVSSQVNSERLNLKEQEEIAAMLKQFHGDSIDSIMYQDGTINTYALEQSVEAAKLKRAKELAKVKP